MKKDGLVLKVAKNGFFAVKFNYTLMEATFSALQDVLEPLHIHKSGCLCLRSLKGNSVH